MKRLLITLLIFTLTLSVLFSLSACGKVEETHTHKLTHISATSPTCDKGGNKEYWKCSDCHKIFSDAEGKNLTLCDYTVLMPDHNYVNNICSVCNAELFEFTLNPDNSSYALSNISYLFRGDAIIPSNYKGLPVTKINFSFGAFFQADSITIPDSVTKITGISFLSNNSFSQINVDESNPEYKSIDGNLYTKDGKTLLLYASKKPGTHFTIPDGVENIGDFSDGKFSNYYSGTNFFFGQASDSPNLMSIAIPESVKNYRDIFQGINLIEIINHSSAEIPSSLAKPSAALLIHSDNESKIVNKDGFLFITANDTNYLVKYIGNDTKITLPESYNGENYEIYDFAFAGLNEITSITIPDNVDGIGHCAFSNCTSLSNLTIGKSVKKIGPLPIDDTDSTILYSVQSTIFQNCISLSEITVASQNTTFKSIDGNLYTKDGKTLIKYATAKIEKQFTIPNAVEKIEEQAFCNAYSLEKISFNDSITKIPSTAFADCIGLLEINFPDTITEIGISAFNGCESIKNVTLNAKIIDMGAFAYCNSLETVIIGDKVENISTDAFYFSQKLKSVTFTDTDGWFATDNYENSIPVDVSNPEQNLALFPPDTFNNYYILKKQ